MLNRSLTFVMVAMLAAAAHAAEESPATLYVRGLTAFDQGLYDVAAANFADYVAAYPTRRQAAEVGLLLAESNARLGRYAEAAKTLDWLEQSRWSRRTRAEVSYWRAELARRTGRTDEALAAFAAFLDEYPEHERAPYARLGLGQARLTKGDLDEALAAFDSILAAAPEPDKADQAEARFLAALGKARCLIRQDKVDAARTLVLEAVGTLTAREFLRAEAFLVLGEAASRLGEHADALDAYKKAFVEDRIYSWYPEALYGIAWCHIELGEYEAAREVLAALAADYPDDAVAPRVALTTAKLDMLEGRHNEAIEQLRAFLDGRVPAPLAEEASYLIADALLATNKLDEAMTRYEAFLADHPDSAFAHKATYGLGVARLRTGKTAEAITLLKTVADSADAPLAEQALRRLGEHLFAAADYEHAAGHYRALLEPERFPALKDADRLLFRLAWCDYKLGDYDGAIALLQKLLKEHPKSDLADNAQYRLGGALYRQGKYAEAIEAYEAFAKQFPESELADRVAYQTGVCHYNLGDYYPALLAYHALVEQHPESPLVHRAAYEIGWCHYMLGKSEEAFQHFKDYITTYPDSPLTPEVMFWLGEYGYNRADYETALGHFGQIVEQYTAHDLADAALYWAGRSCLNLEQYDTAQAHFARVLADYAESDFAPDARYQMAVCLIKQGQHAEALKTLEPLAREGAAPYLAEKVDWRVADCHLELDHLDEARPLYETLSQEARDDAVRAWAQYGLGRCHQAEKAFGQAIREFMGVASDYPIEREVVGRAMVEAGRCYEALGKRNEALIVYASVVRKSLPGKAEAEERIKSLRKRSFLFFKQD